MVERQRDAGPEPRNGVLGLDLPMGLWPLWIKFNKAMDREKWKEAASLMKQIEELTK